MVVQKISVPKVGSVQQALHQKTHAHRAITALKRLLLIKSYVPKVTTALKILKGHLSAQQEVTVEQGLQRLPCAQQEVTVPQKVLQVRNGLPGAQQEVSVEQGLQRLPSAQLEAIVILALVLWNLMVMDQLVQVGVKLVVLFGVIHH